MARLIGLDLALMGVATLVAGFFRLYQIDALPPGLHYDEAFMGIAARNLLETHRPVIFYEGNFGTEALAAYVVAGLFLVLGVSITTIRLMPAVAGILTVPALYLLVKEMFPQGPWPGKSLGLADEHLSRVLAFLSALVLSILYWHVSFSRYGVESNLLPLFEVLAFYFLWRGFRTGRWSAYLLSGAFLGLSLYTYRAARMLPILLVLFFVYRLVFERQLFVRIHWRGSLVLGVAALITLAPLSYYSYRHLDIVNARQQQVSVVDQRKNPTEMIATNASKAFSMFLVHGDEDPRSNLPGRPVLDPVLAVPFLLGAALLLPKIGGPQFGFLVVWFLVMLAPTVFSEYAPHFRRTLGTAPVVAILVALGLTGVFTAGCWMAYRLGGPKGRTLRTATAFVVAIAVAASAFITYRDYFLVWGRSNALFSAFDVGIMNVAYAANDLPSRAEVFMSPVPRSHLTIEFLARKDLRLKSYDGRRGFVFPARSDVDAAYVIVTDEDQRSLSLIQDHFPEVKSLREGKTWDGRPYYTVAFVPARSARHVNPTYPLEANLGNKIAFHGFDTPRLTYKPGDVIPLFLYWQALGEIKESYTVFTHLLGPWDDQRNTLLWGQQDRLPLSGTDLTSDWDKGDIAIDEYAIPIRDDAPPGDYQIEIGMYLLSTLQRLPSLDLTTGEQIDDRIVLGTVHIERR